MYEGIGETDEIFLHWNKLTNANQTQITLQERLSFNNAIPYYKRIFRINHTVFKKLTLFYMLTRYKYPK